MRQTYKNIILIGFMGVGKGSVARVLARKMRVFAIDCDDLSLRIRWVKLLKY